MKIGFIGSALVGAAALLSTSVAMAVDIVGPDEVAFSGPSFSSQLTEHDKLAYCIGLVGSSSVALYFHGILTDNDDQIRTGSQGIQLTSIMSDKVEELAPDANHKIPAAEGHAYVAGVMRQDTQAFAMEMSTCAAFTSNIIPKVELSE